MMLESSHQDDFSGTATSTLGESSATRVVAIDLRELSAASAASREATQAAGRKRRDSGEPMVRSVEGRRVSHEEMLKAFRAMRTVVQQRSEDERVIDAIVDEQGPGSLSDAINGA